EHEGSILFGLPTSRQQKFLVLRFVDVKEQHGIDSKGFLEFFNCSGSRQGVEDLRELNIEKLDENIVQKHRGSKQVGFKQLGPSVETGVNGVHDEKHVWFEVKLQGAHGDREAEVFQVSNDDTAVAQRRLEDKQPEEKTNTECLGPVGEMEFLAGKVVAGLGLEWVWGKDRSSSKLYRDQTSNSTSSTNPTPKGCIRRSSKQKVKNSNSKENPVPMAENQTMAQLLQAPTDGYEDAIVIPEIAANNFKLKHVFPPSKTTNLRNEITRFQQRFDESFYEAWDHFNDLLRACPHHGFSELHQLDTFYNALNVNDQDSLNSAAAVELNCVTYGGNHAYQNCPATSGNVYQDNIQEYVSQAAAANYGQGNTGFRPQMVANQIRPPEFPHVQNTQNNFNRGNNFNQNRGGNFNQSNFNQIQLTRPQVNQPLAYQAPSYQASAYQAPVSQTQRSGTLPGNTVTNPKEDLKGITTQSGVAYQGPTTPTLSKVAKQGTEVTKDKVQTSSSQSTAPIQPTVTQSEPVTPVSEPVVTPVSAPMPNLKPSIPYPSRRDTERRRDHANEQIEKFYEIFKKMSFEISFTDALILMPKFASTLKAIIGNKEKLSEMARTPMNENCSAVILNKFPKKLGDPGKFLIPCEFIGMDECLALADLGASINLMPLFVWKRLSLPKLTPTCMTLELADRSVSKPIGIAKDVSVKVGVFYFPADFVVVDFELDPRVPLILGRCFLKTSRALIDVHKGELTLCIGHEAITYNLDQTCRYSANYDQMMANKIDVTDEACEEYSQEVLGFFNVTASGSPTPFDDPIVSTASPTLTLFGDSDFLLFEEADAFLSLEDDPDSPELDPSYYDPEGDILSLEAILNSDPLPPLPNHDKSVPSFKKELKACEAKTIKSSIDEPPEVELKDLPPHLEYAFLESDNKLPVIISKALKDEEKSALIKVLKSYKRAIAWKLSDIQGINPKFCTHKILMEEDYKPVVQNQRRVNPKIHDIIKKEVEKLLDAGLITRSLIVHGSARKLKEATCKDHFPLPFMDQMLERLAGNKYYCFLDGFSGYFQIPIDPCDQEKTTFTCPYGTFAYRRMPFGLCNAPGTFQRYTHHAPMPNLKPSIPYPSRRDNERLRDHANKQIEKFYEIFKEMSFEISFTDALMLMPKFASTLKALIGNKEKLGEMARTPMNEHCLAVILNKLPKNLDPGKFLIPCEFPGMDECLALADLGASINLMPLSVWKGLSLPELTPTCMTLELVDRTESKPVGIAKDVKVKVGIFHFPADFVVVDFEPDPRVPLI
nr:DNA-directed DNA polymerase [Tanacetum cinerariifolium]